MTLAVTFRRAARAEFIEAAAWYEAQRQNLGVEFVAEIDRCIALAAEQPLLYPEIHKGMRRVTTERFPYSVYFRMEVRRVVVMTVFHGSRDQTTWRRRV